MDDTGCHQLNRVTAKSRYLHEELPTLLAGGVVPVRAAAAKALCRLLHAHPRATHRHDVCLKLVREHAHARSCLARTSFIAVVGRCTS
jgi:hypothetical protein